MEMKDRVLEKATELFTKYGIKSITMDEIAAQLGISKKTIYLSFTDKNELVSAVFNRHINHSEQQCILNKEKSENAVHEIVLVTEMFFTIMQSMNAYVLYDLQKYHPEVYAEFLAFKNNFLFNSIMQNLRRGVDEKLYRDDFNFEIMTRLRLASVVISMNVELFPSHQFLFSEVEGEVVRHYLYGIVTAKGAKIMKKYHILFPNSQLVTS